MSSSEDTSLHATLLAEDEDEDESENEGQKENLRPGEEYAIYNTSDALGTLPPQYDAVIKRAARWCGVQDDYVAGVVERFERRLLRWWARRTAGTESGPDEEEDKTS